MKKFILAALISVSTLFASSIEIEGAYARATPPHLPNSAAFMTIKNTTSESISVVSASSNVSKVVELHTHTMKDGVMKMIQIPKIDIPANAETTLKPGGLHIMFIGLHNPLKKGESVTLRLNFSNGESKEITAPIKTVMGGMKHHGNHMKCGN